MVLLTLFFLAGMSALVARLWHLQIEDFEKYTTQIPGASKQKVRVPGVRGEIRDRNGTLLVTNDLSYEVLFNLKEIEDSFNRDVKAGREKAAPKIPYITYYRGRKEVRYAADIAYIVKKRILPTLQSMGLARDFSAAAMRVHLRTYGGAVPWSYRRDLTFEEFARLAERHNQYLEGISFNVRAIRRYVYDALASHVLGNVSPPDINKVDVSERQEWDYYLGDDYGVSGIESSMNEYLRGRPGHKILLRDEKKALLGEVESQDPKAGSTIFLTLDARIQFLAEQAMREAGIGRGAAVVMDPRNGDILAMVSVPSYDPNNFIPAITVEHYRRYEEDKTNPLMNRAIRAFPPGSTFKIPVALGGLLAGKEGLHLNCNGGRQYGRKFMKCWIFPSNHGSENLSDAVKDSCNGYFFDFANKVGINSIAAAGKLTGFGERTGIELDGESAGILPSPQWLAINRPGAGWTPADSALTGIGQGYVMTTPVQMASMTATVASGGLNYQPRLVWKLVDAEQHTLERPARIRFDLNKEGISRQKIEVVRKGMWRVVNEQGGTARRTALENEEMAAKTGTAQTVVGKPERNIVWFVSFAPYESPRFAISVMVEGGKSGGGVAGPIARRIMQGCLALNQGFNLAIRPLPEAVGAVTYTESVSYANDPVLTAPGEGLEEEVSDVVAESAVTEEENVPRARPVLEADIDADGVSPVEFQPIPRATPVPSACP